MLEQGPEQGLAFWNIDTDGSVLVATPKDSDGTVDGYTASDCEIPSGACEEVGQLQAENGDPEFVGNDM